MRGRGIRRIAALAAVAVAALAGCTSTDGVAGQVGDAGYIAGSGSVTEFPPAERGEPVDFAGETISGERIERPDGITVVNFWYAGCPPCRAEAPVLVELAETYSDVAFVGVNVRDGAAQARSFEEQFGIDWPSILDADEALVQVAFAGQVAPNAVPTTILLDREGRVAARVSGAVDDTSILSTLIEEELAR